MSSPSSEQQCCLVLNYVAAEGADIPDYILLCVEQLRRFYDGQVYFILNEDGLSPAKRATLESPQNRVLIVPAKTVRSARFHARKHNHVLNTPLFATSFERIYNIYELMKERPETVRNVWQLECDNLLFVDPRRFAESLERIGIGLACCTIDAHKHASLALSYFRDVESMEPLMDFLDGASHPSEMEALFEFHRLHPDKLFLLPHMKHSTLVDPVYQQQPGHFKSGDDDFIFDGARIGQYLYGFPNAGHRRLEKLPDGFEIYRYPPVRWQQDDRGRTVPCVYTENGWCLSVANLHIHSKELEWGMTATPTIEPLVLRVAAPPPPPAAVPRLPDLQQLQLQQKSTTTLQLFNIDLHVSVIADVKSLLTGGGGHLNMVGECRKVTIVDRSLSGHRALFGRQDEPEPDVITSKSWRNIDQAMCDRFYARYRDELAHYDGFVVTHTPAFLMLYLRFKKPIIVVNSCRYQQPFEQNAPAWAEFNRVIAENRHLLTWVSNNRADQAYLLAGAQTPSVHIPSLCLYTDAEYTGAKNNNKLWLIYGDRQSVVAEVPGLLERQHKRLRAGYRWSELYAYRGVVCMPYETSTMSVFEMYSANVPMFFPSRRLLRELVAERRTSHLYVQYGQALTPNAPLQQGPHHHTTWVDWWLDRADFYDDDNMPHIQFFDSLADLPALLAAADPLEISSRMRRHNVLRKLRVVAAWTQVLEQTFPTPAHEQQRLRSCAVPSHLRSIPGSFFRRITFPEVELSYETQTFVRDKPRPYIECAAGLFNSIGGRVVVEVGSARNRLNHAVEDFDPVCCNDGHSTFLWKHNTPPGTAIYTVDIDPACKIQLDADERLRGGDVQAFTQDAHAFLRTHSFGGRKIDLLFLDAWDVGPGLRYAENHLEAYDIVKSQDKLAETCIVLIDDTDVGDGGKGELVIPRLLQDGFTQLLSGRQSMFFKSRRSSTSTYSRDVAAIVSSPVAPVPTGQYEAVVHDFLATRGVASVVDVGFGNAQHQDWQQSHTAMFRNYVGTYQGFETDAAAVLAANKMARPAFSFKVLGGGGGGNQSCSTIVAGLPRADVYLVNGDVLRRRWHWSLDRTKDFFKECIRQQKCNYLVVVAAEEAAKVFGGEVQIPTKSVSVITPRYDVVIPLGPNDVETIGLVVKHALQNIVGLRILHVVGSAKSWRLACHNFPTILSCGGGGGANATPPLVRFVDEDGAFSSSHFTMRTVGEALGGSASSPRVGWYYQQLLKLYAGRAIPGILDNYLVIDADVLFLKPIDFYKDQVYAFTLATEFHRPYFEHMARLHPSLVRTSPGESGISHHMLFNRTCLERLFRLVEDAAAAKGGPGPKQFWRVFLAQVDAAHREGSGASEYEMYFNFMRMTATNPSSSNSRRIALVQRRWKNVTSATISDQDRAECDFVCAHHYMRQARTLALALAPALAPQRPALAYRLNGGRLGDNLLTLCKAMWVARKHNWRLLYLPFPFSDKLRLHGILSERGDLFSACHGTYATHTNYNDAKDNAQQQSASNNNNNVMYTLDYYTPVQGWRAYDDGNTPIAMDAEFRKMICEYIAPLPNSADNTRAAPPACILSPEWRRQQSETLTVAIHVRTGEGFDLPLRSMLPAGAASAGAGQRFSDDIFPGKFPPLSFYIQHLKRLVATLPGPSHRIQARLFTDAKDPASIVTSLLDGVGANAKSGGGEKLDITCSPTHTHEHGVLEDLFAMTKFQCLIRGDSSFSKVTELIGNFTTVLSVTNAEWTEQGEWVALPRTSSTSNIVVCFCLWGSSENYNYGALENALILRTFYPGARARFYVQASTVLPKVLAALKALDYVDVIEMDNRGSMSSANTLWRFQLAFESSASAADNTIVLVRDVDSRISLREQMAVNEWIRDTTKPFHIMRDHECHGSDIMAGMFGIRNGYGRQFLDRFQKFARPDDYSLDQIFLSQVVYPVVRREGSACVHAAFHAREPGARPFPLSNAETSAATALAARRRQGTLFVGDIAFDAPNAFRHLGQPERGYLERQRNQGVGVCSVSGFKQEHRIQGGGGNHTRSINLDNIVVCQSTEIGDFLRTRQPRLNSPYVLLSLATDSTMPEDPRHVDPQITMENSRRVHDHVHLRAWFTTNVRSSTAFPKLHQLPLGIDFHTLSTQQLWGMPLQQPLMQESQLLDLFWQSQRQRCAVPRKRKCLVQFAHNNSSAHLHASGQVALSRADIMLQIRSNKEQQQLFHIAAPSVRTECWRQMTEFDFSVCPAGNGFDTHRLWESLFLGCIAIVQSTPLDPLMRGLPVVIVSDFSTITSADLERWSKQYTHLCYDPTTRKRYHVDYWFGRMREKL